uniref:HYLS1_C domain-containing protein n=1 Tax=Mesocestoides corti TaxID=53468 RepID=A0A5K3EMP0_MESCO
MRNKSVYELSYRPFKSGRQIYKENLSYRLQRRLDELSHHPFQWSDDSDSTSSPESPFADNPCSPRDTDSTLLIDASSSVNESVLDNANVSCVRMRDEGTQTDTGMVTNPNSNSASSLQRGCRRQSRTSNSGVMLRRPPKCSGKSNVGKLGDQSCVEKLSKTKNDIDKQTTNGEPFSPTVNNKPKVVWSADARKDSDCLKGDQKNVWRSAYSRDFPVYPPPVYASSCGKVAFRRRVGNSPRTLGTITRAASTVAQSPWSNRQCLH